MGRLGNSTQWSLGHRVGITMTVLAEEGTQWCQAALGPALWGIPAVQCPPKPKWRRGLRRILFLGGGGVGTKKLSSTLPIGIRLGPGYCLLWETVNNIFLLKTRLASDQFVPSQFHREKILSGHSPWVWEFLAPIWPLGSVHHPGLQFNGFCLEALWNNSLAGRYHP